MARLRHVAGRVAAFLSAAHYAAFGGIAAVALAPEANAAVIQSSITNLLIPVTVTGTYLNIITGTSGAAAGAPGWDFNAWGTSSVRFWANNSSELSNGVVDLGGSTPNLALGTFVDGSSTFGRTGSGAITAGAGQWVTNGVNNIGFRFTDSSDGSIHFGWASVMVGPLCSTPRGRFWGSGTRARPMLELPLGTPGSPASRNHRPRRCSRPGPRVCWHCAGDGRRRPSFRHTET